MVGQVCTAESPWGTHTLKNLFEWSASSIEGDDTFSNVVFVYYNYQAIKCLKHYIVILLQKITSF